MFDAVCKGTGVKQNVTDTDNHASVRKLTQSKNVFSNCNSSDSELVFLCTISQHITLFTGVLMPVMPFLAVVTYLRYAGTT